MQVSVDWLSEHVEVPALHVLEEQLAVAGIEVDDVFDPRRRAEGVVVGLVQSCDPHPQADRLKVCQVTDGIHTLQVVCGAPNVVAGARVPWARVGAKIAGQVLEARTIRGVRSQGMLCSRAELGLEEKSDGLWVLPATAELGRDVFDAAKISPVLTLSITPNRADLLSHIGVAREIAAASGKRLTPFKWRLTEKGPACSGLARVLVEDSSVCRRYAGRVVQNVKVGPSPAWLRERLERVGQRSINNVVDVTNYVLLEMGHPLHAFDLSRLGIESGLPTVRVRFARAGERLKTLDGVERTLSEEDLIVADAHRPIALAGVMGGADSEVRVGTTNILLESAYFDAVTVRRTGRRHGLHTEASRRFERGVDLGIIQKALDRCAQLIAEVAEGDVAKGIVEYTLKPEPPAEITLRLERIKQILGIQLPAEVVVQLLEPLEIRCFARNESSLRFHPPTFRGDVTREIDVIEEIARRYGYDAIPARLPDASTTAIDSLHTGAQVDRVGARARHAMLAAGCSEVVTYGFGSPSMYASMMHGDSPVRIMNPLGEEMSALRTSLLPGLLQVLGRNQRHGLHDVRLFEVGTTFHCHSDDKAARAVLDERDRDLPEERQAVGFVLAGGRYNGRWYEHSERIDFSDARGVLEALIDAFDPAHALDVVPSESIRGTNPYGTAVIRAAGADVGYVGQLHPSICRAWELNGPVWVGEVDVSRLLTMGSRAVRYVALPKFPGTRRDVAVVVGRDVPAETLRAFVQDHAGGDMGRDVVERVRIFDVYMGKPIPKTHVSLAFAIDYRSRERTLTDDEVGQAFADVLRQLQARFGVEIRQ